MGNEPSNTIGYKITISILLVIIAVLTLAVFNTCTEGATLSKEKDLQRLELQRELDSLMNEHERVKSAYGKLSDSLWVKDSIILANADEIKKLLGNHYEYYKLKKKIELLRKISLGYVQQIDSLFTVNAELKDENNQIKSVYKREQSKNEELNKVKQQLTEKMNSAAVLKAYKITVEPQKMMGADKVRDTDKASRVDKIKICFMLSENKLVTPGQRNVYSRISRPDNLILSHSRGDEHSFTTQGETLQYSSMITIDYRGISSDLCLNYNTNGESDLPKGTYSVFIYTDGYKIGQSSFILR